MFQLLKDLGEFSVNIGGFTITAYLIWKLFIVVIFLLALFHILDIIRPYYEHYSNVNAYEKLQSEKLITDLPEMTLSTSQPYANTSVAFRDPQVRCSTLGMTECLMAANCGYAITDSTRGSQEGSRCVPGDIHGPYDKSLKYKQWLTNDPYSKAIASAGTNDGGYPVIGL